jgi:hypothetical protein
MSASVDSLRGAGPPDPSDDGTATDRFRAPAADDATDRFRAPGPDDEDRRTPDAFGWELPDSHEPGAADESDTADEQVTGTLEAPAGAEGRPRRRSRGMRVPSVPPRPTGVPPATEAAGAGGRAAHDTDDVVGPRSAPVSAALTATSPALGAGTGSSGAGSPPPVLPLGGPPPPSSSPTPPRRTAAVGRLALVLVLVAAVIGTVVVLQQGSEFGRTDAGPEEIPALEVAPAQVDLGSVTQPTAIAPPSSLLPGTSTSRPSGQGAPTVSSWANGLGPKTDIPPVALQAYGMADLTMRQVDPKCHMSWVTIAGLSRIESNHGRYRGAHVAANGDIEPRIVGVPLDGTSGNRTIGDTDGGVLDGDATLDRAVGPLQFIPSTWAKWRADGNNDGRADPDNIFDAALAAGHYLCAGGRDLASGQGWRSAVLSYNNSDDYGRRVYAAAEAYANSTTP